MKRGRGWIVCGWAGPEHRLDFDKDWDCPWPLDWQRRYRVLADLVDADGQLPDIAPGVVFDGDDVGKWLQQQKQPATWARLLPPSQHRGPAPGGPSPTARPPVPLHATQARRFPRRLPSTPDLAGSPGRVLLAGSA
ncbi:hypothetical protein DRB96_12165 [Streptomyces sp. ICC1]|nr:hypothetical protein DRB89_16205 [Streptomyces sp. ICC4]AWZ12956.1 hypothetical protein DRB96_12165 [Streptomyces sp. ICC1]